MLPIRSHFRSNVGHILSLSGAMRQYFEARFRLHPQGLEFSLKNPRPGVAFFARIVRRSHQQKRDPESPRRFTCGSAVCMYVQVLMYYVVIKVRNEHKQYSEGQEMWNYVKDYG